MEQGDVLRITRRKRKTDFGNCSLMKGANIRVLLFNLIWKAIN